MVGLSVRRPRCAAVGVAVLLAPLWACDQEPERPWDTGATLCGRLMVGDSASGGEGVAGWVVLESYNEWGRCPSDTSEWPEVDSSDPDPTDDGPPFVYEAPYADEQGYFSGRYPYRGHYSARFGQDSHVPQDYLEGAHCDWAVADSGADGSCTELVLWLDP